MNQLRDGAFWLAFLAAIGGAQLHRIDSLFWVVVGGGVLGFAVAFAYQAGRRNA